MPGASAETGPDKQAASTLGCHAEHRLVILGEPREVSVARAFVQQVTGDRQQALERAALLTSELVTNSITHSNSGKPGGTITVTVTVYADRLRVEVRDAGGVTLPVLRCAEQIEQNGRGLRLVDTYSLKWDYHRAGTDLVTWFECALGPRRDAES